MLRNTQVIYLCTSVPILASVSCRNVAIGISIACIKSI